MKQHLVKVHKQTREQTAAFTPSVKSRDLSCPLKCSIPFYSKGFWDVRKHLKNAHQKSDEECLEIVPLNSREITEKVRREQNGKTEGGKCPIGGCKNKDHVFPKASSLREHLKKRHQSSDEKIQQLVPHQRQQRKKAKLDNAAIDKEDKADEWRVRQYHFSGGVIVWSWQLRFGELTLLAMRLAGGIRHRYLVCWVRWDEVLLHGLLQHWWDGNVHCNIACGNILRKSFITLLIICLEDTDCYCCTGQDVF